MKHTLQQMKKVANFFLEKILFTVLLLTLTASIEAREVSPERARRAVGNWLERDHKPLGARLGKRVRDSVTYRDAANEPLFHVVRLEGGGFVVTSADDGIAPIIAFSESGEFSGSKDSPLWALLHNDLGQRKRNADNLFHTKTRRHEDVGLSEGSSLDAPANVAGASSSQAGEGRACRRGEQFEPEQQWSQLDSAPTTTIAMVAPPTSTPPIAMAPPTSFSPSDVRVAPMLDSKWDQWVARQRTWTAH